METKQRSAHAAATLYASIIGLSFLFSKVALESAHPLDLLFHRFLTSFVAIIVLLLSKTITVDLCLRRFLKLLPLAMFYPLMFFGFQAYGLMGSTSSEAGIIQASVPVFVMILANYVLGEKLEKMQKASVILSVFGVLYILINKGSSIDLANIWGIVLLLCSVLAFSAYNVLARKLVGDFNYWEVSFAMQTVGFVVFFVLALGKGLIQGDFSGLVLPLGNSDYIFSILYLGILSTLGTAMLYNFALSKLEASKVSVFGNLGTVISMIAGVIFLNEQLFYYHIVGSVLIIGGVIGANITRQKKWGKGKYEL